LSCRHLIYEKQFVAAQDGNISARPHDGTVMHPHPVQQGIAKADDMIVIDEGQHYAGTEAIE
jgi:ribulose-5-phosphate 4-epimerase/fuculose-1-phosphate aldolase